MTNELLPFALSYLHRGLSIIPIGKDKKPLISWKEFQTRHATEEEVHAWFQRPDIQGIGIVTGNISSNLVVLDIEKDILFDDLELPKTPCVATGGGGFHFYFKADNDLSLLRNATRFREGMDIRGEGGYVLAPPSLHPSGNKYEWYSDFDEYPLAPVPKWLIDQSKKRSHVSHIEKGVAKGSRNDAAAKYVGVRLTKHPESEWESRVWPDLCKWNKRNSPPLPDNELRTVYESIAARERGKEPGVSDHPSTQTPKVELIKDPLSLEAVFEKTRAIGFMHDYFVEIVIAVYISTFIDKEKNPVWLLIVGNPSSNKTTLVFLLRHAQDTYRLDTMTANPFSSGQKEKEKPKDLLPLINKHCFIVKDYSTLFGRNEEVVRQFVTDLVSIYDGEYTKHSPTRGTIRYESHFSHLGCITPLALNKRQHYMNMVGARFLQLNIPRLTDEQRSDGLNTLWTHKRFSAMEEEAALFVSSFCAQLKDKSSSIILEDESQDIIAKLNALAQLTAHARGIVITEARKFNDADGKETTHYETIDTQIEEPFRALFQLRKLARSLAIVRGKERVTDEEIATVRLVVLSSMSCRRAEVLKTFQDQTMQTAKEVAARMDKDWKTVKRHLDELCSLGILDSKKGQNDLAREYFPIDQFRDVICNI